MNSIRVSAFVTYALVVVFLSSCLDPPVEKITHLQISVQEDVEFVVIDQDTLTVLNQQLEDTIQARNGALLLVGKN